MELNEPFLNVFSFLKSILREEGESEDVARAFLEDEGTFTYVEDLVKSDVGRLHAEEARLEETSKNLHASKAAIVLEVSKSEDRWKNILTEIELRVVRKEPRSKVFDREIYWRFPSTTRCVYFLCVSYLIFAELHRAFGSLRSAREYLKRSPRNEKSVAKYLSSLFCYGRSVWCFLD
jgi:hypothetical protein